MSIWMTVPKPESMNAEPPQKRIEWKPKKQRTEWRHHPEFRFTQSMKNELQPNLVTTIRYLRRNAYQFAQAFDPELAANLLGAADYLADVWEYLREYQEDTLKPLYAQLFPGKTEEESDDE